MKQSLKKFSKKTTVLTLKESKKIKGGILESDTMVV